MKRVLSFTLLIVAVLAISVHFIGEKLLKEEGEIKIVQFKSIGNAYVTLKAHKEKGEYVALTQKAQEKINEFSNLDKDTSYEVYDSLYEEIVEKYLVKLDKEDYIKFAEILSNKELEFLHNPNRNGQP